jgi:hypothetical protein
MTEDSLDRLPGKYRQVGQDQMARAGCPYPRLVWLWVYYRDGSREWSTTGSGVLIDDDVILTCAHIFAFGGGTLNQVVYVSAHPGYNQPLQSDREPDGGQYVDTVFVCGEAFPNERRQDKVDSAWDLAVACLSRTVPAGGTPAFVVSPEPYLEHDPAFKGPDSQLMTAGYGGPDGVMVEARMPIVDGFAELHWIGVDLKAAPGQSGAPVFYPGNGPARQLEYRLVGVVSAEDRERPDRTLAAMVTDETAKWIESAQETWRKVKELDRPGLQRRLLVRLHYP